MGFFSHSVKISYCAKNFCRDREGEKERHGARNQVSYDLFYAIFGPLVFGLKMFIAKLDLIVQIIRLIVMHSLKDFYCLYC